MAGSGRLELLHVAAGAAVTLMLIAGISIMIWAGAGMDAQNAASNAFNRIDQAMEAPTFKREHLSLTDHPDAVWSLIRACEDQKKARVRCAPLADQSKGAPGSLMVYIAYYHRGEVPDHVGQKGAPVPYFESEVELYYGPRIRSHRSGYR
jgi:hypothetical protein